MLNSRINRLALALVSLPLLFVSWWAPIFTLTQLWLFEDSVSMLSVVFTLIESGNWFLFILIVSASMLLPLLKIVLLVLQNLPRSSIKLSKHSEKVLKVLARWAMLDIWVVALLIVMVKVNAWVDAQVEWGLYLHFVLVLLVLMQNKLSPK